jgi:hypothetical protein
MRELIFKRDVHDMMVWHVYGRDSKRDVTMHLWSMLEDSIPYFLGMDMATVIMDKSDAAEDSYVVSIEAKIVG